jgi:predicted Zn-dependent protease
MNARKLQFTGAYFDGLSAKKHEVTVDLSPRQMTLSLPSSQALPWSYEDLRRHSAEAGNNPPFHLERTVTDPQGNRLESLTVDDPAFLSNLRQISAVALHTSLKQVKGSRHLALAVAVLVIPLFLYGLWKVVIPELSDRVAMQVPVSWEEKLGQTVLDGLPAGLAPLPQPAKEKVLKAIIDRLLTASPDQPYDIRIYISPHEMVNAIALPGGHIVVFQGLLEIAKTPEELAGVLAHEIQHVLLRHSTRGIIRSLTSQLLLTLMVGDMNGSMEMALNVAGELDGLRHSRNMERQADRHGMEMILTAGIDPDGMVRMFEKLGEQEKLLTEGNKANMFEKEEDSSSWTEYLSTHPAGQDRVSQLKKQVAMSDKKSYTPLLPDTDWNGAVHQELKPKSEAEGKTI